MKHNCRYKILIAAMVMQNFMYGNAAHEVVPKSVSLSGKAGSQAPKGAIKAQISTIQFNGFEISRKVDPVTGKLIGTQVVRPDGTSRIAEHDSVSDTTLHLELDPTGKEVGRAQVSGGVKSLDLSFDTVAKIAPPKPARSGKITVPTDLTLTTNQTAQQGITSENSAIIDAVVKEQIRDPKLVAEIEKSSEYKKAKSTIADKLAHNYNETMNFLSSIQWSKLSPAKTIAKTASSSARQINNFFKDVSIAAKKSMPDVQLEDNEKRFEVRGQAVQIARLGKRMNLIRNNIIENEGQLKTAQEQLKIEQSKAEKDSPYWVAKYKKDIANFNARIGEQNNQLENLKSEQTKLMGDKFNEFGEIIALIEPRVDIKRADPLIA